MDNIAGFVLLRTHNDHGAEVTLAQKRTQKQQVNNWHIIYGIARTE